MLVMNYHESSSFVVIVHRDSCMQHAVVGFRLQRLTAPASQAATPWPNPVLFHAEPQCSLPPSLRARPLQTPDMQSTARMQGLRHLGKPSGGEAAKALLARSHAGAGRRTSGTSWYSYRAGLCIGFPSGATPPNSGTWGTCWFVGSSRHCPWGLIANLPHGLKRSPIASFGPGLASCEPGVTPVISSPNPDMVVSVG